MAAPPLPPKGCSSSWARDNRCTDHDNRPKFPLKRTPAIHPHSTTEHFSSASASSMSEGVSVAPPLPPRPCVGNWNPKHVDILSLVPPPPRTADSFRNSQRNLTDKSIKSNNINGHIPSNAVLTLPLNLHPMLSRPPHIQNTQTSASNTSLQPSSMFSASTAFVNNVYQTTVIPCVSNVHNIHHSRSAPNLASGKPSDFTAYHRGSVPNGNNCSSSSVVHHSTAFPTSTNDRNNQASLENVLKFMKKKRDSNLIDLYCGDNEPYASSVNNKKGEIDDILRLFDPLTEVDESVLNLCDEEETVSNEGGISDEELTVVKATYDSCKSETISSQKESCTEFEAFKKTETTYASIKFDSTSDNDLLVIKQKSSVDSEMYSFVEKLKKLRSEFFFDDYPTNAGVVISPTLDRYQEDALSIQLIINSIYSERPVSFTCDVNTSIEHIISHTVCTVFDNTSSLSMDNFVLKVYGLSEYFSAHSCLVDYEYVHQCHKFDKPVLLTLIDIKDLERPFARTRIDDVNSSDLKADDIAPKRRQNTITYETLNILIETLEKEVEKMKSNAIKCSDVQLLSPQGVVQAVKALCIHLSHVETTEMTDAVSNLIHVSLLFGKSDVSDFDTLPELECSGMSKQPENKGKLKSLCQLLELSLKQVKQSVHQLLVIYSSTFNVNFEVPCNKKIFNTKAVTDTLDTLLFQMGIVHGLTSNVLSQFDCYNVTCEVCYGEVTLGTLSSKNVSVTKSFFPKLTFDEWLQFETFSMCTLPRESVLFFTLWGMNTSQGDPRQADSNQPVKTILGWCGVRLFTYKEELVQGSLLLGLWDPDIPKCSSPVLSNPDPCCPLLQVTLPQFECTIVFPRVIDNKFATFHKRSFECLEPSMQMTLMEIIKRNILSPLTPEEKELLWEKRNYLHKFPDALAKVLLSAHGWDWACLSDVYSLLKGWQPLSPDDSLRLLLPCFPDYRVREVAINWMKDIVSDELCDYLPQMIQVLRYETWDDSPTAWFLLERSLTSVRVAHYMYWLLKQNTTDPVAGKRMELMLNALLAIVGRALQEKIYGQEELLSNLSAVAEKIKTAKESLRLNILSHELEITHHTLMEKSTCLPLSPSLEVCGVDVKLCSYFTSNTLPLKLLFLSQEKGAKNIESIYKVGDDLRQDMITIQMIHIMDKLWLKEGLDLKIVTFMCVATEYRKGMVELVPESETLRKIQTELGLTGSFKDRSIAGWLQKYNTSELEYQQAVENFTLSCAGYCVATYILGICDRHNDNIMLKTSGHIFHIDFGKFLGDSQMFGTIKRDRTPFVLTSDMAFVINGGDKPSKQFQYFIDLCCQAFNIIRKNNAIFFNLFMLMLSSGIPGLSTNALTYVKKALLPELSEAEATAEFTHMIQESLKSWFTQFNFFIHNLAQLRFTGDHNDDLLLSFIPKVFSKEQDGKISSASIIGYKKMYDPEKYYMYIIKVERQNRPVSSCIFRTYREFIEFHQKLCVMFPLAKFHPLPGNPLMGRTNVREVTERRKEVLKLFLESLMCMAEEISHCDLVYTFFHPLLRDQEGIEDPKEAKAALSRARRGSSFGQMYGQIKLSIVYKNNSLFIMIMHAKNLGSSKGTAPDPYVKTYLLPDPNKSTKRKTKTIFKNCHPTFMEMLVYDLPIEVIRYRTLHVSVWDYDRVQENEFLGAALIPLSEYDLHKENMQWHNLGGFNP